MSRKRLRYRQPSFCCPRRLVHEVLEPRLLLAVDWRNPENRWDVDANGTFNLDDVAAIIDDLNLHGARRLPEPSSVAVGPPPFLDINGDQHVSAVDVLLAIDRLSRQEGLTTAAIIRALNDRSPQLASSSNKSWEILSASTTAIIDRSELVHVDDQTEVKFSGIFTNRRTGQSSTNVRVTNISDTAIPTPLILVIEQISDPTVTVANADGLTSPDGKPLFDLTGQVPGDELDPGETTSNRPLMFHNPNLRQFTIQVRVYYHDIIPILPAVELEIPPDPLGRLFIGAPDGVTLTVRAEGTDPVVVDLGQEPMAAGSRGVVFYGASGTSTTATVTTSGGANNVAQIKVRGDASRPSAFHGDLHLTGSVGGSQVTTRQVTVLKIVLDQHTSELVNDIPVTRTITSIPATADLTIGMEFFRGQLVAQGIMPPLVPTALSVNVIPLNGSSLKTGPNGTVQFQLQQGPGGQGAVVGRARVIYSSEGPGARVNLAADLANERRCDICCIMPRSPQDSGGASCGAPSVQLFSGGMGANPNMLSIPGRGLDFELSSAYRSQASHLRPVATNDFAVDWSLSYSDDRLIQDGGSVIVVSPTHRADTFLASSMPGVFRAPMEYYQQLTINAAGDYQVRDSNGVVKTYEGFDHPDIPGRLVRMQDRDGNLMTFHYAEIDPDDAQAGDEKQVLAFVIDTLGREIRYQYYAETSQVVEGRVATIPHPDGNTAAWGRLARVVDFKGNMNFDGTADSEDFPGQANNRVIRFDYDAEANLVAVTTPAILGTPHGNDYPEGKTQRYDYIREADIPGSVTGLDRERLRHNLISIQAPNETALDPDNPRNVLTYGIDPSDLTSFDRVLTYTVGGTNVSTVPAGGTIQYQYEFVAPVAINTNDPYLKTTVTDRRGNVTEYTYSPFDTLLEKRELTRGFRADEPEAFITRYRYNIDKELLRETHPNGNVTRYVYDQGNPDRFQQGNILRTERLADPARGGDQAVIRGEMTYEPIYQQPASMTDPRGLDPAFTPPIPDPSGRSQQERYTTRYFYDYQEADPALILPLLADQLGISESQVQVRLDAAGVELGLGDLNGDGDVSPRVHGHLVRIHQPAVVLLPESNQTAIEGGELQEVVTRYRYNELGQLTSTVDPEGNVHVYTYFAESDPDGDGVDTPAPADGRVLDATTGGYLSEVIVDTVSDPLRNNGTNPAPLNIRTAYAYDDVGNMISMTDGRGIRTDYFVNEMNQIVQVTRAAAVPVSGPGQPDEPLPLVDFQYLNRYFYDFNDNVVLSQVEDRGNTSGVDGSPPSAELPLVPGATSPDPVGGPALVDTVYKYDILDNLIETFEEVLNPSAGVPQFPDGEFLRTRYRYDANENRVLTIQPEGNATSAIYDERDLLFRTTRGTLTVPELDHGAPAATSRTHLSAADPTDYDVRGGIHCACSTYRYDGNGNVVETVDADDTDLSPNNNSDLGPGDRTRYIHDGFDRMTSVVDSVGNQTVYQYDPAGNMVRDSRYGPVGGSSPTTDGLAVLARPVSSLGVMQTANLVIANLLEATERVYDELSRVFQMDRVLFVSTMPTIRPPDVSDGATDIGKGNLTPDDNHAIPGISGTTILGRVTTRMEYDRSSRATFTVEDDGDTYRWDYDGVDRVVRTLDPEGNLVEMAHDDNHNVIETRETDVSQVPGVADEQFLTTYFYDSLDRLERHVDNLGHAIFYRYDSRDNLVSMADAQGPLTGASIERRSFPDGPLTVNDINDFGNVTRYFYDGISRQTRQEVILTDLLLSTGATHSGDGVHVGASIFGVKDVVTSPESFLPTADVNQGSGELMIRVGYSYDQNSLRSALVDDNGNITLYLYDNLNRRVTETKGLVITSPFTISFILGDRRVVTPTAATINAPAFIPAAQLQTQLDAAQLRITAVAGLFPPLADDVADPVPPPQPTSIVFGYDPDDNVLIREDENDTEVFTHYDAINRPIAVRVFRAGQADAHLGDPVFAPDPVADPDGPHRGSFPAVVGTTKQDYQYDGLSRLVLATDNNDPVNASDDSQITYAYDSLSRVIEETQTIGGLPAKAISSAWRAENLRSALTYPNERQLVYTYDGLDRLQTVSDMGAVLPIVDYDYIGTYRVLVRAYPQNGTRMTYLNDVGMLGAGYDGLRRPIELRHLRDDNTLIVGFTHSYDRMNNKLDEAKLHDPVNSEVYSYDSAYRLIDFARPNPDAIDALHSAWRLDGLGNWRQVTSTESGTAVTETREHSSFNELIRREDGAPIDLAYDDNGNQVSDGNRIFQWDFLNRLRRVLDSNGTPLDPTDDVQNAEYLYDAVSRRIRKVIANSGILDGTTDFYLDGWREIEERDTANALTHQYVYGVYIDEPLVLDRNLDGDGTAIGLDDHRLFYHQNTLYSAIALTDNVSQILEGYQYDAYGRQALFLPGPNGLVDFGGDDVLTSGGDSVSANPYLFVGRRSDSEIGLYYYRTRYTDTSQGRFILRDTPDIWQDTNNFGNGYAYAGNNPINAMDPFGLQQQKCLPPGQPRDPVPRAAPPAARQPAPNPCSPLYRIYHNALMFTFAQQAVTLVTSIGGISRFAAIPLQGVVTQVGGVTFVEPAMNLVIAELMKTLAKEALDRGAMAVINHGLDQLKVNPLDPQKACFALAACEWARGNQRGRIVYTNALGREQAKCLWNEHQSVYKQWGIRFALGINRWEEPWENNLR